MTEKLTAWVRTVVPAAWAAVVAWLLSQGLPESFVQLLGGLVEPMLVPLALAAVYAGIRWVEPRLPDWLSRLLTGSAKTPHYAPLEDGAYQVTSKPKHGMDSPRFRDNNPFLDREG